MATPQELIALLEDAVHNIRVNDGALRIVGANMGESVWAAMRPGIEENARMAKEIDDAIAAFYAEDQA